MTTAHTPGPWIVSGDTYPIHILAPHRGGAHDPEHICTVGGDFLCPESPDENEANARLIATSPNLLELCEEALAHLQALVYTPDRERLRLSLRKAIHTARGMD